jgi:hypothetical protein
VERGEYAALLDVTDPSRHDDLAATRAYAYDVALADPEM